MTNNFIFNLYLIFNYFFNSLIIGIIFIFVIFIIIIGVLSLLTWLKDKKELNK